MKDLERALMVAEVCHSGQRYDEIYPYMYHVKRVVEIAKGFDMLSEQIVVACALHDCLEDTSISYNKIKKSFGGDVADIVYAVTDELGRTVKERKERTYPKIKENWKAVAVKLCDRIANAEHSLHYSPEMYQSYSNSYENFKKGIYNQEHPAFLSYLWDRLDEILIPGTRLSI